VLSQGIDCASSGSQILLLFVTGDVGVYPRHFLRRACEKVRVARRHLMRPSSTGGGRFVPILTIMAEFSSSWMDLNSLSGVGRSKGSFVSMGKGISCPF
jgi:hypothetical protein